MTSGRPGQWELLGESGDPLPGDASAVSRAAKHYSETASSIRDQVARLRQIGEGTNQLVGQYQPALQESAEDLADHLDQAQGRFDTVASQLGRWAPVLSDAYTQTGSLLRQAESAQQTIDANQPPGQPVDPKDDTAVAADHARGHRLSGAQDDLARIKNSYDRLMNDKDGVKDVADDVAKKIDDASHDKLKDSWWDSHVRKWIHDHSDLLKLVADVLTWIATAIIIVVMVVGTGGLALAALLLVGALVIHTLLAANGDGSWTDVALDAFALVTLGLGPALKLGAKGALAMREGVAAYENSTTVARAAFANASGFGAKAATWLRESNALTRTFNGLKEGKGAFDVAMEVGAEPKLELAQQLAKLVKPGEWNITNVYHADGARGVVNLLTFGDKEAVEINHAVHAAVDKYGSGVLLKTATGALRGARLNFSSATVLDYTAKTVNPAFPQFWEEGAPPIKGAVTHWSEWAEEHTVRHGGFW